MANKLLIFTDLDGTLLDHESYSWQPAHQALARIAELEIPLIFNSSKTAREIEALRAELNNFQPYIVENGGAVYLPATDNNEENLHFFGQTYREIRNLLEKLRQEKNYPFTGFADLGISGVMEATGLSKTSAEAACQRQATEPLLWHGADEELEAFRLDLAENQLQLIKGGRFYHVMGQSDKGMAMTWLTAEYQQNQPQTDFITVALGDGANDLPMLAAADIAVIIKPHSGQALRLSEHPQVLLPEAPGPAGWQNAMMQILDHYTKE